MTFKNYGLLTLLAGILLLTVLAHATTTMPICNVYKGSHYNAAKKAHPELADAIDVVQQHGVVPWYTDNMNLMDRAGMLSMLTTCGNETKIPMVVYGIPNKDCEANYSNAGSNQDFNDYKAFIKTLTTIFPTQHMVYIVEPDVVGLVANGGCGITNEYPKYLKYALARLSKNPNAELYLDIGFWSLLPSGQPKALVKVVKDIWPRRGRVKGIALNSANYQTTIDMIKLCDSFATLTNKTEMQCIIDTSRNHRGPSAVGEWCNYKGAGIGEPPTMDTGHTRAAYFLWIKPPGESDGSCDQQTSDDAMPGPAPGMFFKEHFESLWQKGFFVENKTNSSTLTLTMRPTTMST